MAEKKRTKQNKKTTLEAKGPFGGNVFKNAARYTFLYITFSLYTLSDLGYSSNLIG